MYKPVTLSSATSSSLSSKLPLPFLPRKKRGTRSERTEVHQAEEIQTSTGDNVTNENALHSEANQPEDLRDDGDSMHVN